MTYKNPLKINHNMLLRINNTTKFWVYMQSSGVTALYEARNISQTESINC